jgi:N-acetylneuraminic acid mutarotase
LLDGRILVVGGLGRDGVPLASAEIFDPATGTWSETGSMLIARSQFTATALVDGRVLVVGGLDPFGTSTAECELYDPNTGAWTATTSYPAAITSHLAVRLLDGRVLVVSDNTIPNIYDPTTATWSPSGSSVPFSGYHQQTLTLMADGRVIVVGGAYSGLSQPSVYIYNPATKLWTMGANLIEARQGHTATLLPDGRLLVVGGLHAGQNGGTLRSAELYDPATNLWAHVASLGAARAFHTATELPNGDVVVVGGTAGNQNIANAEIYHLATNNWDRAGLTPPVIIHAAALLPDGQVLAIGGFRRGFAIRDCEIGPPAGQ